MFVKTKLQRRDAKRATSGLRTWLEPVTNPGFGKQVLRRRRITLDFLAQLPHKDAQVLWLFRAVGSPDSGQQRSVRDHLARTPRQKDEQVEFLRREMDFTPRDFYRARIQINRKISGNDYAGRLFRRRCPPQVRSNSRQQFVHAERLGDVVI